MSDLAQRRISFILKQRSAAWVSRETGIPQSTLSYVKRGLRQLPAQYRSPLRNTYQRETYAQLRAEGAPSHQARRFSWKAPETVTEAMSTLHRKRNELTMGLVMKKLGDFDLPATQANIDDFWEDASEALLEGLQNSPESLETIYDY